MIHTVSLRPFSLLPLRFQDGKGSMMGEKLMEVDEFKKINHNIYDKIIKNKKTILCWYCFKFYIMVSNKIIESLEKLGEKNNPLYGHVSII